MLDLLPDAPDGPACLRDAAGAVGGPGLGSGVAGGSGGGGGRSKMAAAAIMPRRRWHRWSGRASRRRDDPLPWVPGPLSRRRRGGPRPDGRPDHRGGSADRRDRRRPGRASRPPRRSTRPPPTATARPPPPATLAGLVALATFAALDGPFRLLLALADSYDLARLRPSPRPMALLVASTFGAVGRAFGLALQLAAPAALALIVAQFAAGLLARSLARPVQFRRLAPGPAGPRPAAHAARRCRPRLDPRLRLVGALPGG